MKVHLQVKVLVQKIFRQKKKLTHMNFYNMNENYYQMTYLSFIFFSLLFKYLIILGLCDNLIVIILIKLWVYLGI